MAAPMHKRIIWKWNIIRRKLRQAVWIPPAILLPFNRTVLRFASFFADTSRDAFISSDLDAEQRPEADPNRITVSRSLGEVCRLPWPRLHLDMHVHFCTSRESQTKPKEIIATINVHSLGDWIPTLIDLVVVADGNRSTFKTEALAMYNPDITRVTFVVPFEPDSLRTIVSAKHVHIELEGLRFRLGSNAKTSIFTLVTEDINKHT
jgi:hypothetical protein